MAVAFGKSYKASTFPMIIWAHLSLTIGVVNGLVVDKWPVFISLLLSLVILVGNLGLFVVTTTQAKQRTTAVPSRFENIFELSDAF